jgi:lysozyme family protein
MSDPRSNLHAIIGTRETSDNSTIVAWADTIGRVFPEMNTYAHLMRDATGTPWCGFCQGYVHALAGIRPPYALGNQDKSFMLAASWKDWGTPVPKDQAQVGDLLVFPHHVTLVDKIDSTHYYGLGGNQSDEVMISAYAKTGDFVVRRAPATEVAVPSQKIVPLANARGGASDFDIAATRVLADEGGFTDDPKDGGGPTNYGITIYDVRLYLKADATADDVRHITPDQAKTIFRSHYWDPMHCDDLPAGVDYCVFDYGVNSGIGRAPKILQALVGAEVDGEIGPETIDATNKADPRTLINAICDERMEFLQGRRNWPRFKKGWTRRVSGVRTNALAMIGTKETPMSDTPPPVIVTAPPPTAQPARDWAHTGLAAIVVMILGWLGVTLPDKLAAPNPVMEQTTIDNVVQAAVNPQNAGLILKDPKTKEKFDLAILKVIQSGVPGQALQVGAGAIPGVGGIVAQFEPLIRQIAESAVQKRLEQNQSDQTPTPAPRPAPAPKR